MLVVRYFPVRGEQIDLRATGDVSGSLQSLRQHTDRTTQQVIEALQQGSRYHGYKDPSAPASLRYTVVGNIEYLEPLPTWRKPGHRVPMTDYNAIMARVDARTWVEERGVKEIWVWGYHGGVIDLWESNMAGPWGDISNSDRDPHDLPVFVEDLHRLPLQLPARAVGGGRGPHAPDRGGAAAYGSRPVLE